MHFRRRGLSIFVAATLSVTGSASAQTATGAEEIRAALAAIQNRCPADSARANRGALETMMMFMEGSQKQPLAREGNAEDFYIRSLQSHPETDERELARFAVLGMLREVDFAESTTVLVDRPVPGQLAGVGLELQEHEDGSIVLAPIPGFPAEHAGIRSGDRLVTIDGQATEDLTLEQTARLLRGALGTVLNISIARAGPTRALSFAITRAPITIRSVSVRLEQDVAIVRIRSFNENTPQQLREAITTSAQNAPNGYVLDLRGNSGGLLEAAVESADLFLEEGPLGAVVSERQCPAAPTQTYRSTSGDDALGRPIIILTSNDTASGAELFTAALVQRRRAISVGQKTFGADLVTTAIPLSERSMMQLTTGRLTGPIGERLGDGLEPTIRVDAPGSNEDPTLERALQILTPQP